MRALERHRRTITLGVAAGSLVLTVVAGGCATSSRATVSVSPTTVSPTTVSPTTVSPTTVSASHPVPGDAAGPPSAGAVAAGRYVRPVVVTGLRVTPSASASTLGLTWTSARDLLEATSVFSGSHSQTILGFGTVTIAGLRPPAGVPVLTGRPAWVGIFWGGTYNCPNEPVTTGLAPRGTVEPPTSRPASVPVKPALPVKPAVPVQSASTVRPVSPATTVAAAPETIYTALIIYGSRGHGAVVYTGRGTPPCDGALEGPTVTRAEEVVSVPWRPDGPVRGGHVPLTYRAPACATMLSTASGGDVRTGQLTITIDVELPFDGSGCGATVAHTTSVDYPQGVLAPGAGGFRRRPTIHHGRTGPVRSNGGAVAGRVP